MSLASSVFKVKIVGLGLGLGLETQSLGLDLGVDKKMLVFGVKVLHLIFRFKTSK